jgi:hypothetical protein
VSCVPKKIEDRVLDRWGGMAVHSYALRQLQPYGIYRTAGGVHSPGNSFEACLVTRIMSLSVRQLDKVQKVFQRFRGAYLTLKPENWQLFPIPQVGTVPGTCRKPEGVTTDPEKLKAVQCWTLPTDKHDIRCLLGLCTFCISFISEISDVARPLTRVTD